MKVMTLNELTEKEIVQETDRVILEIEGIKYSVEHDKREDCLVIREISMASLNIKPQASNAIRVKSTFNE